MIIKFEFIITGAGEAVFSVDGQHKIYSIEGVNSLQKIHINNKDIIDELKLARVELFNDATLVVK